MKNKCEICDLDFSYDIPMIDIEKYKISQGIFSQYELNTKFDNICGYHLSRQNIKNADILICTNKMIIDPKLRNFYFPHISQETVIICENSENIDKLCTEYMSLYVNLPILRNANELIEELKRESQKLNENDTEKRILAEVEILQNVIFYIAKNKKGSFKNKSKFP